MKPLELEGLADRILQKIRKWPGHFYEIANLSKAVGAKTSHIVAALEFLRQMEYVLKIDKKGRCAFISAPDRLLQAEILFKLKTKMIGRKVLAYQTVQSTNTIAAQMAQAGIPEGTIVVSERQTKGRGRMGRKWHSPDRQGIYCSIILYPKIDPSLAPGLSLMAAVALAETIKEYNKPMVQIKWPNDVLLNGKKTAGILTELSAEIGRTHHVVVGVGINIKQKQENLPEEIRTSATSLVMGLKREINRVEFLRKFLLAFEKEYAVFRKKGFEGIRAKMLKLSCLMGKEIRLRSARKIYSGRVVDIDHTGRLVLETGEGPKSFAAGEVTLH